MLPNENFLIISNQGLEFQNKNGIAEMMDVRSQHTTTSSVQKLHQYMAQKELSTPKSTRSNFGKRTLSIALSGTGSKLDPNTTPRGKNRYGSKRASESKGNRLNKEYLMLVDPTRPMYVVGDSERFSLNSGLFSDR